MEQRGKIHVRFLSVAGIVAAAIVLVFVALKIHLPVQFWRPCQLLSRAEWTLVKTGPDSFEGRLIDRSQGLRQQFDLIRFDRGDFVHVTIAPTVRPQADLRAGTEVARLESHTARAAAAALELEVAEAEALLRVAETGEKSAVVAQARSELEAQQALSAQLESSYRRAETLHATGMMSAAEYEEAQGAYRQAAAAVAAAENQLRSVAVGEKDEVIASYRARIALLQQQRDDARSRLAAEVIRTPIAGQVLTTQADSALVRIADIDTLYALAPVPPSRIAHLRPGDGAIIVPLGWVRRSAAGGVIGIDREVSTVGTTTFCWVTVAVPNPDHVLQPGVTGRLRFSGARVTLLAWVMDQLRHASDRTLGV